MVEAGYKLLREGKVPGRHWNWGIIYPFQGYNFSLWTSLDDHRKDWKKFFLSVLCGTELGEDSRNESRAVNFSSLSSLGEQKV